MKKYIYFLFFICIFCITGCSQNNNYAINIVDKIYVGEEKNIALTLNDELVSDDNILWTLSSYDCAEINNGILIAKAKGSVVINAIDKNDVSQFISKEVQIVDPYVEDIEIKGTFEVIINKTVTLKAQVIPAVIQSEIMWESLDPSIATVNDGVVKGISEGETQIVVSCDGFEKEITITVLGFPTTLNITSKSKICVGEVIHITNSSQVECMVSTQNNDVVYVMDDFVQGLVPGKATLNIRIKDHPNVSTTMEIEVVDENIANEATLEEIEQINEIMSKMNVSQLVGEMFNISFSIRTIRWYNAVIKINGVTGLPDASFGSALADTDIVTYLNDYPFGNYTIVNDYTQNLNQLKLSIETLKKMGNDKTGINPFIFINYAGGNLKELDSYGSNKIIAYNEDATLAYNIGNTLGMEFSSLGINGVLNNYVSYNSNVSFGDNSIISNILSSSMKEGYYNNGIMMGAGQEYKTYYYDQTSVDAEIKQMENVFKAGFECVCVPLNYMFVNNNRYSLVSYDYISKYRQDYNGIIMANITNSEIVNGNDILKALNDGCDMFYFNMEFAQNVPQNGDYGPYMENMKKNAELPFDIYNAILSQISDGSISIDRIKESVFRILLSKLRNGILENETYPKVNTTEIQQQMTLLNTNFIGVKGNMDKMNTDKPIIVISDSNNMDGNPFGYNVSVHLKDKGFKNCSSYLFKNISISQVTEEASSVGSIYILINNMNNDKKISATLVTDFVQDLYEINPNICIIFDGDESQADYFPYLNNFIFLNNYYDANYSSLVKVLDGEGSPYYIN